MITDATHELALSRPARHRFYRRGILRRVTTLAKTYHLPDIPDVKGGTLIDCGANIGELGVWAKTMGMHYIAFEPEECEARCIEINVFDGAPQTRRLALWNETKTLEFYHKPETADSSLIEMADYDTMTKVSATRLDEVIEVRELSYPVVLKIEAEGAEPEALEGAGMLLAHIDYITVDCGPERGKEKRHTFIETCQFLNSQGFTPEAVNFSRHTVLYRNHSLKARTVHESIPRPR
jgi:FkbM family methyltransferase